MELRSKVLKELFKIFDNAQYKKLEYVHEGIVQFYVVGKAIVYYFLHSKEEGIDVKVCMLNKDKFDEQRVNNAHTYSWNFTVSSVTSLIGHIEPILNYIEADGYELKRSDLLENAEEFRPRNYVKASFVTLKQFKYASNIVSIGEHDDTTYGFIIKDHIGSITWMSEESFNNQFKRDLPCAKE